MDNDDIIKLLKAYTKWQSETKGSDVQESDVAEYMKHIEPPEDPILDVEILGLESVSDAGVRTDTHMRFNVIIDGKEYRPEITVVTIQDSAFFTIERTMCLDDLDGCPRFKITPELEEELWGLYDGADWSDTGFHLED